MTRSVTFSILYLEINKEVFKMNEYIDRSMGFDWVRPSCVNRTEEPKEKEPEFSAPRIEIENGELVIKQKETK